MSKIVSHMKFPGEDEYREIHDTRVDDIYTNIQTEGAEQIEAVKAQETESVAAVQAVADSIPEDYTEMAKAVSDLQAGMEALENLQPVETKTYYTWTKGRKSAGSTSALYYSTDTHTLPAEIIFDGSVYSVSVVRCNDDESEKASMSWNTSGDLTVSATGTYTSYWVEVKMVDGSVVDADALVDAIYEKTVSTTEAVSTLTALNAICRTVYVSASGSDSNDGTKDAPYLTIQHAIDTGAGIVYVAPGEYTMFHAYDLDHPLTVCMDETTNYSTADDPMIKIVGTAQDASPYHAVRLVGCTAPVRLYDIWAYNSMRYGFTADNCTDVEFIRCTASENQTAGFSGFHLENSNGILRNCRAHNCQMDGFNFHGYGNSQLIDCVAYENGDDGVSHHDGCTGTIIGGEYYSNAKAGIASPYGGATVCVSGAYSHDNAYGLYADSDSSHNDIQGRVSDSTFKNNTTADIYVADGEITGWNLIYDTKSVHDTGTFTEVEDPKIASL